MGYIRHHSIVITSTDEDKLQEVYNKAIDLFKKGQVTNIIGPVINGYYSFFIGPDGSKEGWEDSDIGDKNREEIKKIINNYVYEDGSNFINYCEFFYGDDNKESNIINYN
jgi:hypothetical protein